MKRELRTYWTVRTACYGGNAFDMYFRNYENAKKASLYDYRDKPIKHTVTLYKYALLEHSGAFMD